MIALLLAGQASALAAPFSPPLDRPYRVVWRQERTQAGTTHRFELERRLVFRRDAAGLVAEMTLTRVWQDVGGKSGQRFAAAAGALKDRTLRLHLAADGAVTAIDDEAAVWAATLAGIEAAAAPTTDGRSTAPARDRIAATLAVTPERRRAALASPLASLIARDAAERLPGTSAITLAGGLVAGRPLHGTRTVTLGGDARLHVLVKAAADETDAPSLERNRAIDPASGLVIDETETQRTGSGTAAQVVRQHIVMTPVS